MGGPDKGPFYGEKLNADGLYFDRISVLPSRHRPPFTLSRRRGRGQGVQEVREHVHKSRRGTVEEGGQVLRAREGPPLDDLFEIGVYSLYHGVGVTESGKKVCWSIKGRDGYFETARMAVEAALAMTSPGTNCDPARNLCEVVY